MKIKFINIFLGILLILSILLVWYGVNFVKNHPNKDNVSWSDNINNPQNIEFVNEVKFNNLTNEELQFQFCLRYYNCLSDSSKIWMSNQILKNK